MASELTEIIRFLGETAPFDALEKSALVALARSLDISYHRAGARILDAGQHNDRLFVVRSGAVELKLAGEELTARLGQGASFAYPSLLRGGEVRNMTEALEDTLLYAIPAERFHALRSANPAFAAHFTNDEASRIKHALERRREGSRFALDERQVGDLLSGKAPVTCPADWSIRKAVELMAMRDVSTLAISQDGALAGIFTDKDLRKRVVASGLSLDGAIGEVMTQAPRTLAVHSAIAEAMAMMASGGFRHIPLIDESGGLAGILSATDILSAIGANAIDTGMMIARARTAAELVETSRSIPESFATMVRAGTHGAHATRFTSALGEAVHRRAAELAEEELGAPPCTYALVVFGSLAREEQLTGSDQDNALVIDDSATPAAQEYFAKLANRICDLLDACGYVYCKGGIMASNAEQRLTLSTWRERYADWIARPSQDRILAATIFFDMRAVHGNAALVDTLRGDVIAMASENPLFISYLARDALRAKVPLGFFRNLVLEKGDGGQSIFDAKAQAIMPIIDIARTLALAGGIEHVGSAARLRSLAKSGRMNRDDARSLEDALLFVNDLRIEHQARQIERGEKPDNAIAPADLSPLERDYLKDAFVVIRDSLDALRRNHAGGIA